MSGENQRGTSLTLKQTGTTQEHPQNNGKKGDRRERKNNS
jgi:hypothetical protein